jgi:FlaA1/EpsC-like NDP-sugar epimerase
MVGARVVILVAFHLFVFTACYVFSTLIRFDFALGNVGYQALFRESLPFVVGIQFVVGYVFGFYRGWWRYVGVADVIRIVAGTATALILLLGFWYAGINVHGISRGVLLINFAFVTLCLFGARVLVRLTHNHIREHEGGVDQRRVLVLGAGDAGEALVREIQHRPQLGMKVVAFVDDNPSKWNSQIRGIRVRGPIDEVAAIAKEMTAREALIAMPSAPGPRLRQIVKKLSSIGVEVKTIPGLDQLVTGKVQVTQLRPVNIEDLLRREEIQLPGKPVEQLFRGKRVMITGAGGTIGAELASQVLAFGPQHISLVERSEYLLYECGKRLRREQGEKADRTSNHLLDVRDHDELAALMREAAPQIVLHAAAHKHVPLGEENPPEYLKNNCLATRQLAEICERSNVDRFVLISTDKAINPTSVMGATKRAAEIALLDFARSSRMKVTAVRFGNVLGSSGSAVPLFLEQIAAGGPVTVTDPEVTRYFLRTSEAISLVLQAAALSDGGCVYMLDMGEPVRIVDLARDLIQLSNHTEEQIPIVFTGLRPGEKLFEEVRLQGESTRPTRHPQIVVTEAPQPAPRVVNTWLQRVEAMNGMTRQATLLALKELIPEYQLPPEFDALLSIRTAEGPTRVSGKSDVEISQPSIALVKG